MSKNSQIPVPRVITAFESTTGHRYILMALIRGVSLSNVFDELSGEKERKILGQLRNCISELRALPSSEPGYVDAVDLSPLHDERVHDGTSALFIAS